MKLRISVAERQADVLRCQYFIAEIYNRRYQIMFSEEVHDLEARIEPYPQRYLMGTVDGELVATLGLYTRNTYVERYGDVTEDDIHAELERAGALEQYAAHTLRELTKLVVADAWEGRGLVALMQRAAHADAFMEREAAAPVLVLVCGKVSLFKHLFYPRTEVRSRFLAPFPRYPMHAAYRTEADPMESRLIIPSVDVPREMREQTLPLEFEIPERKGSARA